MPGEMRGEVGDQGDIYLASPSKISSRSASKALIPPSSLKCQGAYLNASIVRKQDAKQAIRVLFYRNGDRHYPGMNYAISYQRFRNIGNLMEELSRGVICEKTVLNHGVRHIFRMDGTRVNKLEDFEDGGTYIVSSNCNFKKMNYSKAVLPRWNSNTQFEVKEFPSYSSYMDFDDKREYIYPKLITVIRNGTKPRKAVRMLLNKKTCHNFDQLMMLISNHLEYHNLPIKRIFSLSGKKIQKLEDFFGDDSTFIACGGQEKCNLMDFDVSKNEIRFIGSYTSPTASGNVRVEQINPKVLGRPTSVPKVSLQIDDVTNIHGKYYDKTQRQKNYVDPSHSRSENVKTSKSGLSRATSNQSTTQSTISERPSLYGEPPEALTSRYRVGKIIGEGNFAIVRECSHRAFSQMFALKIINKARCKGREHMIDNEVALLRRVKHPNIVQLVEDYDTPDTLYLVMEYVKGGDLFDAIATASHYTERDASGMLYNLASALKYLHAMKIVHRDIKPENLLVCEYDDGSKSLKLGDFGLAVVAKEPLTVVCGTPTYVAPEILAETGYNTKVDVWSAGVITYILLCGFPPFSSAKGDQEELFGKIMSGKYNYPSPYWTNISESAKSLISLMLQTDPIRRLSAIEVLQHPWVTDDKAKDDDLKKDVTHNLDNFFTKTFKFAATTRGVDLITATALDKASRFFEGRIHVNNSA